MTAQPLDTHPVVACVDALESALDSVSTEAWSGLEHGAVRSLVGRLARVEARLVAQKMAAARMLEESGAARAAGATSTGALLAKDFGGDRHSADRLVRRAERISKTSHTQEALSKGRVTPEQADVIATGLAKLPSKATPAQRDLAERTLLKDADRLRLPDLRRRTDRLMDVYADKKQTDRFENDLLVERERRARAKTRFRMWDSHDGTWSGDFTLPTLEAASAKAWYDAVTAPAKTPKAPVPGEPTFEDPYEARAYRAGLAFADLWTHLPTDRLPNDGGVSAVVTVTMELETLQDGIAAATLSDGTRLSASQARKVACGAGIIPTVLDGRSNVLDHGLKKSLFTPAQRRALAATQGGCNFPGCDRPPAWCEAHHLKPYDDDGPTDLDNGALLCCRHHHHVHDDEWEHQKQPDGTIAWRPPGATTWQTNHRYRP
ncbi:MAG: DUF222 domain-containing protein [Aeromicrobium erythreum]